MIGTKFEFKWVGGYVMLSVFSGVERRHRIRNKLQYFYSIVVFLGVLSTAYLMMEREGGARRPIGMLQPPNGFRLDAGVGDEALARLIEVEKALLSIRETTTKQMERNPRSDRVR